MKKLTKQRIFAPILALTPILIYFAAAISLAVCVSFAGGVMGMTAEEIKAMPLITNRWLDEIGMGIAALCACVFVKSRNKISIKKAVRIKEFDFAVPVILTLFTWSFGEIFNYFSGLLLSNFMTVEPNSGIDFDAAGIIVAVVCAPIFEELIFRFAAVEFSRGAYSMPIICIANGIYFAVVHTYNIQGLMNIFISGCCMAYVYCKTENILYTILTHAMHNAICFIPLGYFAYYKKNGFVLGKWYWLLIHAIISAACLVWYFKVFRKKYTENNFKINREIGLLNLADQPVHI